jgi:D-serine/D-alanine/glycine transporter
MFLLLGLNMLAVKAFGEVEFWFGLIKVVAIVLLVITGLVMVATAYTSPAGDGVLQPPGCPGVVMPHGILGFLAGQIAIFRLSALNWSALPPRGEEPEKTLPKAINTIPVRILLFYIAALACIISVVSWPTSPPIAARSSSCSCWVGFRSCRHHQLCRAHRRRPRPTVACIQGRGCSWPGPSAPGTLGVRALVGHGTPVRALMFSGPCMALALTCCS